MQHIAAPDIVAGTVLNSLASHAEGIEDNSFHFGSTCSDVDLNQILMVQDRLSLVCHVFVHFLAYRTIF